MNQIVDLACTPDSAKAIRTSEYFISPNTEKVLGLPTAITDIAKNV